jgi:hypothetical protein
MFLANFGFLAHLNLPTPSREVILRHVSQVSKERSGIPRRKQTFQPAIA